MNVKVAIKTLKKYDCKVTQKGKDLYIVDECGYTEQELIELAQSYTNENYIPRSKPKSAHSGANRKKRTINLTRDWDSDEGDNEDW
jgi:hypothetical protein